VGSPLPRHPGFRAPESLDATPLCSRLVVDGHGPWPVCAAPRATRPTWLRGMMCAILLVC